MKIKYNNEVIATIIVDGHNVTLEEALEIFGYDVKDPDSRQKAYDDGFEAAYIDDEGTAQIDIEAMSIER